MTTTVEQIELEELASPLRRQIASNVRYARKAFKALEESMQALHKIYPNEHLCAFTLTAPEIFSESK